jgi:hypothetical protein
VGDERVGRGTAGRARHDDRQRIGASRPEQIRVERESRERVEHDAARMTRDVRQARGQLRVIRQRRADPDRHSVDVRAPAVDALSAGGARDPLRVTAAGRDLSVERHRGLEQHPGTCGAGVFAKRLVQKPGADRELAVGHDHLDSLVAQDPEAATRRVRARIVACDHHPADPSPDDRLGARRGTSVMAAGLERHVHGRPCELGVAGRLDRLDLGMRRAERAVEPLADQLTVAADHRPDEGVRADPSAALLGQLDRPRQMATVCLGLD